MKVATALVRDGDAITCVTVKAGRAQRRVVRVGLSDAQGVEIVEGLGPDEAVVASQAGSLTEGQAVQAEPAAPR